MKKLFLFLLSAAMASAGFGQAANRNTIYTAINTNLPSNGQGAITAATLRAQLDQIVASAYNPLSDGIPEPALGNPLVTGYVLTSTNTGTRSWVPQSGGGGGGTWGSITGTLSNQTDLQNALNLRGTGSMGFQNSNAVNLTGGVTSGLNGTSNTETALSLQGVASIVGTTATLPTVVPVTGPTAFQINVGAALNTVTVTAVTTGTPNETFTFSGTPSLGGQSFSLLIANSDSVVHTPSFPTSFSLNRGSASNSFTLLNGTSALLTWKYDGIGTYFLAGDPVYYSNLSGKSTPVNADLFVLGDSTSNFTSKNITFAQLQTAIGSGFANPMTTTGDMIYASSGSTPARLAVGTSNQVLQVIGGVPSWQTLGGTVPGFTFTALGTGFSIAAGTTSKTLTVSNTMTLAAAADGQTFTFPSTSASIARTDAANTFTGTQTFGGTVSATNSLTLNGSSGHLIVFEINSSQVGQVSSTAWTLNKPITTYNNIATAGWGVPSVYGYGRSTAQVASVASVATYTPGASDGSFLVSANVNITAYSSGTFTVTVTYTDEASNSRTETMNFSSTAGSIGTACAAAGAFSGIPLHIRSKASSAITIATTGTFSSLTYNVEGQITQID